MSSMVFNNISFLSAAARYNTERRPVLQGAFDYYLREGRLFTDEITDTAVGEYWDKEGVGVAESRKELDAEETEKLFRHLLLTVADDPEPVHYQMYMGIRYAPVSDELREELGYSAVDLVSMEAMIYNEISEHAKDLGIASKSHTFESRDEYTEPAEFEHPTEIFRNKWTACIEFTKSEMLDTFLTETADQPLAERLSLEERLESAEAMLSFLTTQLNQDEGFREGQFFLTPLFEREEQDSIVVPFPNLLVTTAQIRIEELFQQNDGLKVVEDDRKGDLVEDLAIDVLEKFDSRNLVRSFKYTDPHPRETDGVLFFDESLWSVEVKSHPIFRKIPDDLDIALSRFETKVSEAISQGHNTVDFLTGEGEDLLYHLMGAKSTQGIECGTIVVLDGLLPTLFSQNHRIDEMLGLTELHKRVNADDRVYLITLFDLFEIADQTEEIDRLEDFLLWRTDYELDMPLFAFNERDYWAMYFDNIIDNPQFQDALARGAEDDIVGVYISDRFNDKPHLPYDGFEDRL